MECIGGKSFLNTPEINTSTLASMKGHVDVVAGEDKSLEGFDEVEEFYQESFSTGSLNTLI
jgi:hypothetical protein